MKKKLSKTHGRDRVLTRIRRFFPNVKRIKDATSGITVEVTPGDIDNKAKKKHSQCAIAQACTRSMALDGAVIAPSRAFLVKGTTVTRYELSAQAIRELVSFDRGGSFEPGFYRLGKIHKARKFARRSGNEGRKIGVRRTKRHATNNIRESFSGSL